MNEVVIAAGKITLRTLDLDHARASLGKAAGHIGCRHGLLYRNYRHSCKITRHAIACLSIASFHDASSRRPAEIVPREGGP